MDILTIAHAIMPSRHSLHQVQTGIPGDLGFDPLNLKPEDPETWEKVQVR
jgi:hypothetical protein